MAEVPCPASIGKHAAHNPLGKGRAGQRAKTGWTLKADWTIIINTPGTLPDVRPDDDKRDQQIGAGHKGRNLFRDSRDAFHTAEDTNSDHRRQHNGNARGVPAKSLVQA